MIEIRKCTVSEVENAPMFAELLAEYAEEVKVDGAPPISAKMEIYRNLEKAGVFQTFCAYSGDVLAGFITVLSTVLPHFGVIMSVTESFFVSKAYRSMGAGLKLLRTAEDHAKESGSPCLLVSAPSGGVLADVLPHVGYIETNRVFFRNLANV